jgi:hypothetical protein
VILVRRWKGIVAKAELLQDLGVEECQCCLLKGLAIFLNIFFTVLPLRVRQMVDGFEDLNE